MLQADLAKVAELELKQQQEEEAEEQAEEEAVARDDMFSLPTDATVVGSGKEQHFTQHPTAEESRDILNHDLVLSPSQDNMSILTSDEGDSSLESSAATTPARNGLDVSLPSTPQHSAAHPVVTPSGAAAQPSLPTTPGEMSDSQWSTKYEAAPTPTKAAPEVKEVAKEAVAVTAAALPVVAPHVASVPPEEKKAAVAAPAPSKPVATSVFPSAAPAKSAAPASNALISYSSFCWVSLITAAVGVLGFGYMRWRR